jgi:hypothetical protein
LITVVPSELLTAAVLKAVAGGKTTVVGVATRLAANPTVERSRVAAVRIAMFLMSF